ncbi:MAG: acyl-CoA dehydrogenase, partial [Hyphomicrobium sp.]|nr:acyl-CoA dehydrogenase [Hyphomicrobium sp.]
YDPARVSTRAARGRDGFLVTGHKTLVLHAPCADRLIVIARTAGQASDRDGISPFLVCADAPGLQRRDYRTLDGAAASDIAFSDTPAALLGKEGAALPAIEKILDEAVVAVCAEACGVLQKLVDLTVEYTRQRRQFGRAIAEFQVLQHRMVDMLIEVKQAGILTRMARAQLETSVRAAAVSAAKSRVGRACRLVSQAAVQLHGGIGIADETSVSQYFRRALMIEQQFGSTEFHLERYERLQLSAYG